MPGLFVFACRRSPKEGYCLAHFMHYVKSSGIGKQHRRVDVAVRMVRDPVLSVLFCLFVHGRRYIAIWPFAVNIFPSSPTPHHIIAQIALSSVHTKSSPHNQKNKGRIFPTETSAPLLHTKVLFQRNLTASHYVHPIGNLTGKRDA